MPSPGCLRLLGIADAVVLLDRGPQALRVELGEWPARVVDGPDVHHLAGRAHGRSRRAAVERLGYRDALDGVEAQVVVRVPRCQRPTDGRAVLASRDHV